MRPSVLARGALALCALSTLSSPTAVSAGTTLTYEASKHRLELQRQHLGDAYARASKADKAQILKRARATVLHGLTAELAPAWSGTEWAMSGRSATPQEGKIACGTYVGTLLRHAGFRLNRIRMGRLASEHIALSLTQAKNLRRYRNKPAAKVAAEVIASGEGLYMLGLDYHAALIWVDAEHKAHLIHSSVVGSGTVVDEPLIGPNPFVASRYRVVSKLLDDHMIRRWLRADVFKAKTSGFRY